MMEREKLFIFYDRDDEIKMLFSCFSNFYMQNHEYEHYTLML